LAENVVFLIELEAFGRAERRKLPDRLSRQRPAVHQEQHPPHGLGFEEAVNLGHGHEGLAGARRHGHQHGALALGNGRFHRFDGLFLVWPQPFDPDGILREPFESGVPAELLVQPIRRVKPADPAGDVFFGADIDKMDDLAVGRKKKRHPVSAPISGPVFGSPRVTLGLLQNAGGPHAHFLGFDDA